ncbi:hypothetical protein IC762_17750 [Bradyrhizobium genosp. L]|uniref:hypothetical protein n=1 Tax=Bradyrhizobium genosp. L TaxID=83637 RepID=UPI0018A2AE1E|nr:hypothetical protein [Bradyrhizobium genosp. L]QPF81669.1 hypothetical protein IC762_17750 [Bradyrhizobium genosp. L]
MLLVLYGRDEDHYEAAPGGGRMLKLESRAVALSDPIKINGPAVPFGATPPFVIAGGYALTPNVPGDFMEKWMEANKDSPMVKNNVIFVQKSDAAAQKQAKEQKEVQSGLERLDVRMVRKGERMVPRDPRWPKSVNPNLSVVATDTRDVA